jgi:D-sedoheptulose 7-phosphate isomerase
MTTHALTLIREHFLASAKLKHDLADGASLEIVAEMASRIAASIGDGGKLMLCGNGGSAADAQHLAAELLVRLRASFNRRSLAALTLATDTSTLTACGNDFGFDDIFSRPLEGLGRKGDVLLGITTSGRSSNVIKALEMARTMGITTLGFLGGDGGPALELCDLALVVPTDETALVQEVHITAGHAMIEAIEIQLLGAKRETS